MLVVVSYSARFVVGGIDELCSLGRTHLLGTERKHSALQQMQMWQLPVPEAFIFACCVAGEHLS